MATTSYGGTTNSPRIFADGLEGEMRLSYFYLHNKAQEYNDFDLCQGNIEAFYYALQIGYFLCDVFNKDLTHKRSICFVKLDFGRMTGYICYLDDIEGIEDSIKEHPKSLSTYDHFEKELDAEYPEVWKLIKSKR